MVDHEELIQQLALCAATCERCADSCLNEEDINMMVNCIRLDRDCSKMCALTASFLAAGSQHLPSVMQVCIAICEECERECTGHDMDHCQACAKACRECANACRVFQDNRASHT